MVFFQNRHFTININYKVLQILYLIRYFSVNCLRESFNVFPTTHVQKKNNTCGTPENLWRHHFLKPPPPWNGTTAQLPLQRGKSQEKVQWKWKEVLLLRKSKNFLLFLHPHIFWQSIILELLFNNFRARKLTKIELWILNLFTSKWSFNLVICLSF